MPKKDAHHASEHSEVQNAIRGVKKPAPPRALQREEGYSSTWRGPSRSKRGGRHSRGYLKR